MEENVVKQQIREITEVKAEFSVKLQQPQSKSLINFKNEEQILKTRLENLKKENFSLKASIQAWKATFEQKQNELGEAETKLNEIYNQIWSEREDFCERADKFNNESGILSKRWKDKVDEIFNPPPQKGAEKHQGKVPILEMKIEETQKKVEVLEKEVKSSEILDMESQKAESFVLNRKEAPKEFSPGPDNSKHASPAQESKITESTTDFNRPETNEFDQASEKVDCSELQTNAEALESVFSEINTEIPKKKKVRFSNENETIKIFYENPTTLKMKFFSIIDTETVRKANRFRNMRKNYFLGQVTKSMSKFE